MRVRLAVGDGPFELLAAEPFGVDDALRVSDAQVLVCRTETFCTPSYVLGTWPPRGTPGGPGSYRMRGLRVDYAQGSKRYRAEVGPIIVFDVRT